MRNILILATLAPAVALAAGDYVEERALTLDTAGISVMQIEAGAGTLEVRGVVGLQQIEVDARIVVATRDEQKAQQKISSDMILTLEPEAGTAVLHGYFDNGSWSTGNSPSVHLVVRMPAQLGLDIDDGSGAILVENVRGDIRVHDGSGSIQMSDVGGDIVIDDGSGQITVERAGGDVSIEDGSGSIIVRHVAGSVLVDDGSGSINVSDVEEDLRIENDGSGGLDFSDIRGRVTTES